jgi:hypothetical protein
MTTFGDIEWLTPEGAPAPRRGKGSVEDTVSHLPEVKRAVAGKAEGMGREASMLLLAHRKTGAAHIVVTEAPPHKLDATIELRDPDPGGAGHRLSRVHVGGTNEQDRSAMSIEFGWMQTHAFGKKLKHPVHHDGLHILERVMRANIRGG